MNNIVEKINNKFKANNFKTTIIPGVNYIPPSGKVLDASDLTNLLESSLDMWLTAGRFAIEFETRFAEFMNQKFCLLVNSGSSANLVAFATHFLKSAK
jgi:CDP-6-deoxy-D-xylo-4-hexulose-3-dehydrase